MADIERIIPHNLVIPPVPQDRAIEDREKKQRHNEEKEEQVSDEEDNGDNEKSGIDYYA